MIVVKVHKGNLHSTRSRVSETCFTSSAEVKRAMLLRPIKTLDQHTHHRPLCVSDRRALSTQMSLFVCYQPLWIHTFSTTCLTLHLVFICPITDDSVRFVFTRCCCLMKCIRKTDIQKGVEFSKV